MNEKMTDEERAEDYYEDNECYSYLAEIEDFEEVFGFVKDRVIHAYLDGLAEGRKENAGLKAELQNYVDVINQLMGTELTDTEEIGRLIEIAQYRNWSEL